ncbi:Sarcosine oxidase, delta subunit family [compost metagenome]
MFNSEDTLGVVREWWMHNPSSYWFLVERHTGSDEILRTFDPREVFTARVDFTTAIDKETAQ